MKIALIGYGKMGRMIEEIAKSRGHEIVSIIDIDNPEEFDSAAFKGADVAIEFTAPGVAADNVRKTMDRGVRVVSGSTGWLKGSVLDEMRQRCADGASLMWSSNYSVGVAITLAEQAIAELDRKERWSLHETAPEVLRIDDIRRGEVPGIHTVTYDSTEDYIEITHSAYNRRGFALGAVLAAEYMATHTGWQTIDDLFRF